MRFTQEQYDRATAALRDGREQLAPDGRSCRICHDTGHQAWECGHNPLFAVATCEDVAREAQGLHDRLHAIEEKMNDADQADALADWREDAHTFLHYLVGYDAVMGWRIGPARAVLSSPKTDEATP